MSIRQGKHEFLVVVSMGADDITLLDDNLQDEQGIADEVQSWLEDLGFDVKSVEVRDV
jgi:hypothetical protein